MTTATAQSLSALLQQTTLDDHEEILKAATNALKKSKTDFNAQRTRAVALLKLDRYDDALRALEEGGEPLQNVATVEWAYSLYKTGNLEQADRVTGEADRSHDALHVEAQTAYRLEDFPRAARLYETLQRSDDDGRTEPSDLRINKLAANAQLEWRGHGIRSENFRPDREDLEQFETAFNAACHYIARGEMRQAELLLTRARDLCNAVDELSDSEKEAELLPIYVQQIYVLLQLGKVKDAETLCSNIQISKYTFACLPEVITADRPSSMSDRATRQIAQSNLFCAAGKPPNPYLAHRLFHATDTSNSRDAPFGFQRSSLDQNVLALDLQANKYATVIKSTSGSSENSEIREKSSVLEPWKGVLYAAAQAKNETGKSAIKQMLPLLDKRPHDVGLVMTVTQLYILTNNLDTATSLLESFLVRLERSAAPSDQDVRYSPGVMAVLISLYARQNRLMQTKAELAKASTHWRRRPKSNRIPHALLNVAGSILLESPSDQDSRLAEQAFKSVHQKDDGDILSSAGLLASSSKVEASSEQLTRSLPPISELTSGIDASSLESAGIARPETSLSTRDAGSKRAADSKPRPQKPKRARKSRLPNNHDPEKKPDPERWLPLQERSYWRPKGKKKGRSAVGGMATQGGIASEGSGPSTPSQTQQKTGGGPRQAKKKKSRGK